MKGIHPTHSPLIIAALLPLLLFSWFVHDDINVGFWLLWLVVMVFVALPILFLEMALAKRSGNTPVTGIKRLTREADARTIWRIFVPLSMMVALALALLLLANSVEQWAQWAQNNHYLMDFYWTQMLVVLALSLSVLKEKLLPAALLLAVLAAVLALINDFSDASVTASYLYQRSPYDWYRWLDWALALALALAGMGLGTGLYWFVDVQGTKQAAVIEQKAYTGQRNKQVAIAQATTDLPPANTAHTVQVPARQPNTADWIGLAKADAAKKSVAINKKTVLQIWLVQLVGGTLGLVLAGVKSTLTVMLLTTLASLALAAFLFYYAYSQLSGGDRPRGRLQNALSIGIFALALSFFSPFVLLIGFATVDFVAVLVLALFAGFVMKASHLRKSLLFNTEWRYNIWRFAIRWLVPLAVIGALGEYGWLLGS